MSESHHRFTASGKADSLCPGCGEPLHRGVGQYHEGRRERKRANSNFCLILLCKLPSIATAAPITTTDGLFSSLWVKHRGAPRVSRVACKKLTGENATHHHPLTRNSHLVLSLSSDYPQTMQSVALDVWSVFMRKTEPEFRTISSSREKLVWRQKKSTQLLNDETTCAFIASQIHLETSDDIVRRVGFEFCMRIGLIVKIPWIASVNEWKLFPPFPRLTSASQIENNR